MDQNTHTHDEPKYLEGPIRREDMFREIRKNHKSRVSRIEDDFVHGFDKITNYADTVTIFGSARFKETHPYYIKAREVAQMLAQEGYTVITGGGGGIMEGGNRGAYEAGGKSIGFNIQLPQEQTLNPFTSDSQTFRYFFSRKVLLAYSAQAYLFFPGGFGTLDEFFEIITLIQTKKIEKAPIIMIGNSFWGALDEFIHKTLYEEFRAIHAADMKLYKITEDVEEIRDILGRHERKQLTEILGS